jgi:hypothetical protein
MTRTGKANIAAAEHASLGGAHAPSTRYPAVSFPCHAIPRRFLSARPLHSKHAHPTSSPAHKTRRFAFCFCFFFFVLGRRRHKLKTTSFVFSSSSLPTGELRAVLRTLWSGEYAAFPVSPHA